MFSSCWSFECLYPASATGIRRSLVQLRPHLNNESGASKVARSGVRLSSDVHIWLGAIAPQVDRAISLLVCNYQAKIQQELSGLGQIRVVVVTKAVFSNRMRQSPMVIVIVIDG